MRGILRQALAVTIAFVLVTSGAAWRSCMAMHLSSDTPASTAPSTAVPEHHAQAHDRGHGEHAPQPADTPSSHADNHACMKCCSACTLATALPPVAVGAVIFTVTGVVFSCGDCNRSGRTILIDPAIPKTIA